MTIHDTTIHTHPVDTDLTGAPTLGVFDTLAKGDPAPEWLRAAVVEQWGHPGDRTELRLITVSENATFLVSVDGRPVSVVRVARPGYMAGVAAFESEAAWVRAISRSRVTRVPEPLETTSGGMVAVVEDTHGVGWTCVSAAFVMGEVLEDVADPVPHYRAIGRTTALLHDHVQSWRPPSWFRRHSWNLPDMVGPSPRWGRWQDAALDDAGRQVLEAAEAAALAALAVVPRTSSDWGLIHADLRPSNIMIDGSELTVIDFDDSGFGWLMYDFASALTFMEHLPSAPTMAQEWVAGYAEVRPLSRDDAVAGCALSMVRRLQMLGWTTTHREDALPPDLFVAQVDGTVEVARRYLASATWLLD